MRYRSARLAANFLGLCVLAACAACRAADPRPHNVIIFVADGLRHGAVDTGVMPTFAEVRKNGVDFVNSHSVFPTVTTPNASVIATGHYLGDTGDFANALFTGFIQRDGDPSIAVEDNINITTLNEHCEGNYLGEESFIAAARAAGMHTAMMGKHGPVLVQEVTRNNKDVTAQNISTIVIDDATGAAVSRNGDRIGVPLPADFARRLANDPYFKATYFDNTIPDGDPRTPARKANNTTGTKEANTPQQKYLIDVLTRAILPGFVDPAGDKMPFAVVYWSRDPDGTQHNELDVPDQLVPGINGPTVKLAFQNVDGNLKQLLDYLRTTPDPVEPAKKLADTTDLFITSDHGFSTISRGWLDPQGTARVDTFATRQRYSGVAAGIMPPGVIALDLAHDLNLPLYDGGDFDNSDPTQLQYKKLKLEGTAGAGNWAQRPTGPGLLGGTGVYTRAGFNASLIVVGGAVYLPTISSQRPDAPTVELLKKVVTSLAAKPYISGIFVDTDRIGPIPGALSFNDVYLKGAARTQAPVIIASYRTFSTDPANPFMTGVAVSDAARQGQGTHGSFGRQDTFNCMIALGPDFKTQFTDTDPVSNADIAITLSKIMGLDLVPHARGTLHGRNLAEALSGGPAPRGAQSLQKKSAPAADGQATYLQYQTYTDETGHTYDYFDAAGFPGETVGLTVK